MMPIFPKFCTLSLHSLSTSCTPKKQCARVPLGGAKMKDWDKQDNSSDEIPNEGLQDVTDSDSDAGDW